MTAKITEVVAEKATFELVRQQLAAILALELAEQQVLSSQDERFDVTVFEERHDLVDFVRAETNTRAVNVWFDSMRQVQNSHAGTHVTYDAVFNLDVYASIGATQTETGDRLSSLAAQAGANVVRQIICHEQYQDLALGPCYVSQRTVNSVQSISTGGASEQLAAVRLTLLVRLGETAGIREALTLEQIDATTTLDDGQVAINTEH